jgi:ABC-type sugar transport system ATPase subunit
MSASAAALRQAIESAFPNLWAPTEAALAAILTLTLEDVQNPTTLILSGPASGGKTTVLDFVADLEGLTYRCE